MSSRYDELSTAPSEGSYCSYYEPEYEKVRCSTMKLLDTVTSQKFSVISIVTSIVGPKIPDQTLAILSVKFKSSKCRVASKMQNVHLIQ